MEVKLLTSEESSARSFMSHEINFHHIYQQDISYALDMMWTALKVKPIQTSLGLPWKYFFDIKSKVKLFNFQATQKRSK